MKRYNSLVEMFFDAADRFDKNDAVLQKVDGRYVPISHKFFKQRVSQLGRGLMGRGVKPGDHIAILAETRFEWAVSDLAIASVGAATVPLYPSLLPDQVEYILKDSGSTGLLVSSLEQAEKIKQIKDPDIQLRFVAVMDEETSLPDGLVLMSTVEAEGAKLDNEKEYIQTWKSVQRGDLFTLIYTSGTTGDPKGVMLTHENLLANVEGCQDVMPCNETDVGLSHLPLSHVLERMAGLYLLMNSGVTIAYAESIKTMADNLVEVRPTVMVSVPRLFEKIYASINAKADSAGFPKKQLFHWAIGVGMKSLPYFINNMQPPGWLGKKYRLADKLVFSKIREKTGGRLKLLVSGGAPLPKEIGEFFLAIGIKILEGYGLTETSPVLCVNRPDLIRPGTVGPPISNVEIKIADDGEILAKGPNIMVGYYNKPQATEEALQGGWFHTGDVGKMTEEGCLMITDRKKEILVTSGGKNIAPQPIENALKMSPLIEQAVVIGDKRNFITALISPPWETVSEWAPQRGWPDDVATLINLPAFRDAIAKEIEKQLQGFANYEKVKKFQILPRLFEEEKGEMTPSLKIKRRVINEEYEEVINSLYES